MFNSKLERIREENTKLTNEVEVLRQKLKELSNLNEILLKLRVTTSLDTLLRTAVETCSKAFSLDNVVLYLIDKQRGSLVGKTAFPKSAANDALLSLEFPLSLQELTSFSTVAVRNRAEHLRLNAATDDTFKKIYAEMTPGSAVMLPLSLRDTKTSEELDECDRSDCPAFQGKNPKCWITDKGARTDQIFSDFHPCLNCAIFPVVGLFLVDNRERGKEIDKEEIENINSFANYVALAIDDVQIHQEIKALAVRDGLTNLYNHRYFRNILGKEVVRARRYERKFSLIMIDVDNFKTYNDTNGHQQGDEVLKSIATILEQEIRPVDTVARYGGEEFVVILPETDKEGAAVFSERKREQIEKQEFIGKHLLPSGKLTCSFGIATFPDEADDGAKLVDLADKKLYQAKNSGRNKVCL